MIYILSCLFGVGGIVANFLIYQQKSRTKLLVAKLLSNCLWTLHYCFLGAWSGAAVCGIGVIREAVFLNNKTKKANLSLLIFLFLSIVSAIFTWKNVISIFPSIAAMLSVFSFWKGNPKLTRTLAFPISTCFMIYNIASRSYPGIVSELFVLISATIGVIRMKKSANDATKESAMAPPPA